jgi:hypothetical protein
MPSQFHYLRIRLKIEQHRLLNWAEVANLTEQNDTPCATLRFNEAFVQEVLAEQEAVLACFWNIGDSYQSLIDDSRNGFLYDTAEKSELQDRFPYPKSLLETKALRCVEKIRRYPVRVRWAMFDRERLETSLARLGVLNDAMKGMLDSQQQSTLQQAQTRMSIEVLQLNNKIDHLLQIFHAGDMQPSMAQNSESQREREVLGTLARFKALNIEINSNLSAGSIEAGPLAAESCTIFRSSSTTYMTTEIERSGGLYEGNPVWIEWKYYDPVLRTGRPDPLIQARISKLSALLSSPQKPTLFHTPACIGYFNNAPLNRFGLIFHRPTFPPSAYAPTSLFDLVLDEEKPSLSARVRLAHTLATAVQHLHSTNWIHKSIRSQNVIFFTKPGHIDISTPFLCGFGLARPVHNTEMTERPDTTPLYNLYRHPLAHGDVATEGIGGFQKLFDIYSLGIVFLETALWMPLHRVLGIEDENVQAYFRPGLTKKVQVMLLRESRFLDMVRAAAGDIFGDVVRVCLEGFGEGKTECGERFYQEVVLRLERVLI